ncbi:sodium/proline symporter [Sphaerothrix gracilis]|uniref:sodium/proline symporter n=1 Tax=Sphaerothrix gracilis TaxID=3151835 RepID=UPI0031FCE1E1
MSETAPIAITFASFIALFIGVGLYASRRKSSTSSDYLLAGRGVNSWLAALSTVATGNSGFMFIGLIGFTYETGLSAIWISVGYLTGEICAWLSVHKRLRQNSETANSETIADFLGHGVENGRWITATVALLTLGFLGTYAAAQLQAGSKALSVLFDWDLAVGILLGAAIVAIYCTLGGIRASIWVGSVQSILMIGSMILLAGTAIATVGGFSALGQQLKDISPDLVSPWPTHLLFGAVPFIFAWATSGFGVIGQPHIMVRMMTIDSVEKVSRTRNLYLVLNIVLSIAATIVGLTARVLLPELSGGDPELALPELATRLLPSLWVGLVLVGLFSATISTADAQVLSCSAALTQDLLPLKQRPDWLMKAGTLFMVVVVLGLALVSPDDVFTLVTFSWAALAAGLGPLMVVRVFRQPINTTTAIAMMLTGVGVALFWRIGLHWSQDVYEVLPGMVASTLVYLAARPWLPPQ